MIPERLRRTRAYAVIADVRRRRAFDRSLARLGLAGSFDPDLKRRFMLGERISPEEIESKYDEIWRSFADDCVTGDDLETILEHLREDARTCLEVGCGGGRVGIAIAKTDRAVTAVDISGEALSRVAAAAAAEGVELTLVKAGIEALPFEDGAFDVVTCSHTLEHVQDLAVATSELVRVAAKQLIVIVPREDGLNPLSTDYHFQCFPDARSLADAIPLADYECVVARVENEQWHGEYVFFDGKVD